MNKEVRPLTLTDSHYTVSYKRITPYQNIRLANKKIQYDKARNIQTDEVFKDELQFNKKIKKDAVKLKKDLKKYKTGFKEGKSNKGWITRTENKLNHINKLGLQSAGKINKFVPPRIGPNETFTHDFVKEDKTVNQIERENAHEEINGFLKDYGSMKELQDASERLYIYISDLAVRYFGTVNKYVKWAKEFNKGSKNDKIM